jgi:hypothetical protein
MFHLLALEVLEFLVHSSNHLLSDHFVTLASGHSKILQTILNIRKMLKTN